jgi:hypothetical protein
MSRRMPPISWWLRSRPSLWYPDASATRTEPVFHGSIQLDPIQGGDGPRERGQRHQCAARGAAASMLSRHRVARRRAARRQVLKPQPNPAHGVIGFCIGDGERQANSLGESSSLPLDPLQSLLRCGKRGQATDEGNIRVISQLDAEMCVRIGELPKNDRTVGRRRGRPGWQLLCHVQIVALPGASVRYYHLSRAQRVARSCRVAVMSGSWVA